MREFPGKAVRIGALMVVSLMMGLMGCDDGKSVSETRTPTYDLSFVSSSNGLPATGQWRERIGFYDMNLDGHLDILATPPRANAPKKGEIALPRIWYGNGKGEWSRADIKVPESGLKYNYGGICGGDFDGDGIPDMALAMHGIGVRVLKGKGNGEYSNFSKPLKKVDFMSRALLKGDFDGDGSLDIVAVAEAKFGNEFPDPRGPAVMDLNSGMWRFRYVAEEKASKLYADQISSGDINGDGKLDFAVGCLLAWKTQVVWLNDGKGQFSEFNEGLMNNVLYNSVVLSDVNGDGKDDLIACIAGLGRDGFAGIKVFVSGEDGFQDFSKGLPEKEPIWAVATGDLDKDGTMEIIGATVKGSIKIYGLKGSEWIQLRVAGLPVDSLYQPFGVYCVDVNGDGYMDIGINYSNYKTDLGGIKIFLNVPKSDGLEK